MTWKVAVDIGSSRGKVFYGDMSDSTLEINEGYRFETKIKNTDNRLVWDINYLVEEILTGLEEICVHTNSIESIAIDTTAGDFGLIQDDNLVLEPYFHRDPSLDSLNSEIVDLCDKRKIFEMTGYNGVPGEVYYIYQQHKELFREADHLLMLPQLLSYELGADPIGEETFATTLRLSDARTRDWHNGLIEELGLPRQVFPELKPPGTKIGTLDSGLVDGLSSDPDILLAPSHNTAAAMAALPLDTQHRAFVCTGSGLIPGIELDEPVITDAAFSNSLSNELSVDNAIRFLCNVPGFSLLEHCRDMWKKQGRNAEYEYLLAAARQAEPFGPLIDPYHNLFFKAQTDGEVIDRIEEYCRRSNQQSPSTQGEIIRCLLESLAARAAVFIESLIVRATTHSKQVHVGGRAVRNNLFCQMLASAQGLPVYAGPVEATAIGNLVSQLHTTGQIESYKEGRELVKNSFPIQRYRPTNKKQWDKIVSRMARLAEEEI